MKQYNKIIYVISFNSFSPTWDLYVARGSTTPIPPTRSYLGISITGLIKSVCWLMPTSKLLCSIVHFIYHFPLKIPLFSDYYMLGILHTGLHITKKSLISILNKIRNKTIYFVKIIYWKKYGIEKLLLLVIMLFHTFC